MDIPASASHTSVALRIADRRQRYREQPSLLGHNCILETHFSCSVRLQLPELRGLLILCVSCFVLDPLLCPPTPPSILKADLGPASQDRVRGTPPLAIFSADFVVFGVGSLFYDSVDVSIKWVDRRLPAS